jgi:DNA-binding MarR family transcriptional regulator
MTSDFPPEIDLALIRSLAEFRRALRALVASSEDLSRAAGVTTVQYQALLAICAWEGPMAVRDLADELILTHSAAVQTLDRLTAAGLVRRTASGEDRRVVRVEMTLEGRNLLAALAERHLDELLRREGDLKAALRGVKAVVRKG